MISPRVIDLRHPPAPGTEALVQPSPGLVGFTEAYVLLGVLVGAGVRTRIYLASPLRPVQPALWALHGLVEDLAVFSALGALVLWSTRYVWQRACWAALKASIIFALILHLVLAEAVVFFGHAVRARDLQLGLRPDFFLRSINFAALYNFTAALVGVWLLVIWAASRSRRRRRTWATAGRLALVALAAAALAFLPVSIHSIETSRNPFATIVALARDWPAMDAEGHFVVPRPEVPEASLRGLAPRVAGREYFDETYPLAYRTAPRSPLAPTLPEGIRPNLVFLIMEGVRSEEIGAYGGSIPGLTPNLDRLALEGTRVERFYSNGNHTPEGELGYWYGLMPSPYEVLMTTRSQTPMTGLPELLRRAGWKSFLWVHNGDQTFYGRDGFYLPRGFRTIDGRDFPPEDPRTNWGFSDRALARRAVSALDTTATPFAAMVLTVSNHHPFQVPSDARTRMKGLPPERRGFVPFEDGFVVGLHTIPMLETIHYTDEAIGYFFDLARQRPWFGNTVFVIGSDHGLPIAPLGGMESVHRFLELRHRVPLVIYSPLLAGGKVVAGPASQIDVLPTIAGLFGLGTEDAGLGRDLLDPASADPARPVVTWTRDAETVSVITQDRVYHRRLAGEPLRFADPKDEILIDPLADPLGRKNLGPACPQEVARLARAAELYFSVYPWIVVEGRSGLPGLQPGGRALVRAAVTPSPAR